MTIDHLWRPTPTPTTNFVIHLQRLALTTNWVVNILKERKKEKTQLEKITISLYVKNCRIYFYSIEFTSQMNVMNLGNYVYN